jgi:hypothetical protein
MVFAGGVSMCAQVQNSVPGCEQPAELRNALLKQLARIQFYGVPYDDQTASRVEILTELIKKYSREVAPQKELIELSVHRSFLQRTAIANFVAERSGKLSWKRRAEEVQRNE